MQNEERKGSAVARRVAIVAFALTGGVVIIGLTLARAFTNPSQNPPNGGLIAVANGNLGVGTATPSYKLDIASGGATTARLGTSASDLVTIGGGAGKLAVGTVDPLFRIEGEHYATYMAGMVGVREELTGTVRTSIRGERGWYGTLDLAGAERGSDLWLFGRITILGKEWKLLAVILSSDEPGSVWYEKDAGSGKLRLYTTEEGAEISYRLSAPRFDYEAWKTRVTDAREGDGLAVPEAR